MEKNIHDYMKKENFVKRMISNSSLYRKLNILGAFIAKRKPLPLILRMGEGSYTDFKNIVVGIPGEIILDENIETIYLFTKTFYLHELQHTLSTNANEFKVYNEEETLKLRRLGVSERFAQYLVHSIGNIIEDGRIENIAGGNYPGSIQMFQYLRLYFWNKNELDPNETSGLGVVMSAILSLATLGIYPKGYGKLYDKSEPDKELDKIKHLIFEGVKARTCKDAMNICRQILDILTPYILKEYKEVKKEEEEFEDLMKLLQEISNSSKFENSDEPQKNESGNIVIHIPMPMPKPEEEEDDEVGSGKGGGSSKENEDDEDKSGGSSGGDLEEDGDSKEDNKDSKEDSDKSKEDDNNEDNKKDSSKESNDKESKDKEDKDSKDESESDEKDNSSKDKGDGESSDNKDDSNDLENTEESNDDSYILSKGATEDGENQEIIKGFDEDELLSKMREISEGLESSIENELSDLNKVEKPSIEDSYDINDSDIRGLANKHRFAFKHFPNDFSLDYELPLEVKTPSRQFKREIEQIFRNKESLSIHNQEKGVLNPYDLHRVAMKDYNIFSVEGGKSTSDYCAYILQDGSGSMSGDKQMHSAYALSIIEEGLRDVIPFKLTTFAASSGVEHYTVKNWNDKSKKNYSYNFLKHRRASGYNEDGYSIRIATKELLKRPEKDKILIVLSDGMPSSQDDTKMAIKEARDNNIFVVGIMFGNKEFRDSYIDKYRAMYIKNIIAVEPKHIPNQLTKLLKKILAR